MDLLGMVNNGNKLIIQICLGIVTGGAFAFFTYNLIKGRFSPVATASALLGVILGVAGFALLPSLIKASQKTGTQIGGGGGYNFISPIAHALDTDLHRLGLTLITTDATRP